MIGRGDIEAGGAAVYVRLNDAGFKKGLDKIYTQLKRGARAAAAAGNQVGGAIDIPIRKSVRAASYVAAAHQRMGYSLVNMGNQLAMTGRWWQYSSRDVAKWKDVMGSKMIKVGGIMHNFGVSMVEKTRLVRNSFRHMGNTIGRYTKPIGDAFHYIRTRFAALGQTMSSVGKQMAVAAIIMAVPFVAGAKTYAAFSKQMAFVSTMVDDTQKHMGDFTKGIRALSLEFGEGTDKLARGLYDILSAGFSADRALGMLHLTTMAAKAGMADAAESTKAIIAVLNSYSLGAEHAEYVADRLFATVRYGVTTFAELAGHIGLVAASAAQMGVSIEELGASLAVITRGGIETSAAVIALQNVLKAFSTPTGEAAEFAQKLKEAGLGIDVSLKGIKKHGFMGIMKAIAKLPTGAIMQLFPQIRGQRGAMALKAGLANIDEVLAAHIHATGMMREAYAKVEGSFGLLMDRVKQAGILVLSYIGEAIADNLTNVGEKVIWIAQGFGEWTKQNKAAIIWGLKLTATLGELAIALMVVGRITTALAAITAIISGQWWVLAAGITAGIAAWSTIGALMEKVKKELGGMADIGQTLSPAFVQIEKERKALKFAIKANAALIATARRGMVAHRIMWHEDTKGSEREFKIRTALGKQLRDDLIKLDKRVVVETAVAEKLKEQNRLMAAMSKYRFGHFAGYWHTPILAYSTATKGAQELDVLKEISLNTSDRGKLHEAIIANKPKVN